MRTILNLCTRAAVAVLVLSGATGCSEEDGGNASSSGVNVVASTTQLADLAANVTGDRGEVVGILAPNSDPHDYEPRPSDAESLAEADLILQSGGDLDLWLDELVESSGSDAPVLHLLDSVNTIEGEHEEGEEHSETEEEHAEEGLDQHWWQNPRNSILAVEAIRDQVIKLDPEGRQTYNRNASRYIASLEDLDSQIAECMRSIPAGQRKLVTSHDALGYFADRYGIVVVGSTIPALTTQAQPSAGETGDLVGLIREQNVKAVFPEVGVSAELEQAVADETGAAIGGDLYADTLGPPDSAGGTYLDAMASNAETLAEGFTGNIGACEIRG